MTEIMDSSNRKHGRDAQRNNIMAAQLLAEMVRSTLGPKGMDKMLVDSSGNITVTNDGVTILKEMHIEHPAAKMLVNIAKTQEQEVGDGTTTAVILAGELLKQAQILLDQNIHPTVIVKGYRLAAKQSLFLLNNLAKNVTINDKEILLKIASTGMTGKCAENEKEILSNIVVSAIQKIEQYNNVNLDDIKIEKKSGSSVDKTNLINGIVIDKEKVHSEMPKRIDNANIALLNLPLEIHTTEMDAKIQISSPEQMKAFLDQEELILKQMVDKLYSLNVNVVFCQKGIDEIVQHFLAKKGIYAIRRVKKSDMELLSKSTKGKIINNLKDLSENDLGKSGIVEEVRVGEDYMTFVNECINPKAVTILVRGGTEHVIDEVERALEDSIGDLISTIKNGKAISGGGAPEITLSRNLNIYSQTLSGREQLAVQSFAKALEIIPKTLAENAGLDSIEVLTNLKSSFDTLELPGINVFTGQVMDSWSEGVIEPLLTKTQAISSASEVAVMLLRIDDVILSDKEVNNKNSNI